MLKSYERWRKENREKIRVPRSVQNTIPIDVVYKDGIFQKGNQFSKTYRFLDINYKIASANDKDRLFFDYCEFLNSLDSSVLTKITINNRKIDMARFKEEILIPLSGDELDKYRIDYNNMLLSKISDSDEIIQEKYITVTVVKKNIREARFMFSRITTDVQGHFGRLGSVIIELDLHERLKIFHDFYRDSKEVFHLDVNDLAKKGHSFKGLIVPRGCKFHKDYFEFENKVGRVMFLNQYPGYLKDEFISEFTCANKTLMYSMDLFAIPTDEAVREAERRFLGVEKNITDWQIRQNNNNNFSAIIPYDMELQRKECKEFLDEMVVNDQKMFLCNITIVHMADTLEELEEDTASLKASGRQVGCEFETLFFSKRQLDGLVTCLPYGVERLNITRTLLTESCAVFLPFRAQEIMDIGGIWYGQNAITNNPIICNKETLPNANAFVLGSPGAGKSFIVKEEIEFIALATQDDILICDPEGEYDRVVKAMGGKVIEISVNSNDHINAMDMADGCGDSKGSLYDKSQFVMSLFEQLDATSGGSDAIDKSIIDRCVHIVYKEAKKGNYVPTLKNLYNTLLEQPEEQAKTLAIKLELFTNGSLDVFAHETNVDLHNRIINFNILKLGEQLKKIGLLVITDTLLNRVNENWKKGKRTHVFIDEVHVIFENPQSAFFFENAWRQFRKRNAYPTGITQNVTDLLSSGYGTTMISNSQFIVMLQQSDTDAKTLKELLHISDEQATFINKTQPGTGLIKYGTSLVPFINKMPPGLLYDLNDTSPKKNRTGNNL